MDTKLQSQLKTLLSSYIQLDWLAKGNDPRLVLQYIEASGGLTLKSIWASIEENLGKIRAEAGKDGQISRVALDEADFLLEKLQKMGDKASDKYRLQQMTAIEELIDRALIFCPTTQLARVYAFRSKVLLENEKPELALLAMKEAVRLEPGSPLYHRTIAHILYSDLKRSKEALKYIQVAISLADYPRAAEEEEEVMAAETAADNSFSESFFYLPSFIAQLRALEAAILEELMEEEEEEKKQEEENTEPPPAKKFKSFTMDFRCKVVQQGDNSKGRLIIALDSLPPGTPVFCEHVYSMVILPEMVARVCALCARKLTTGRCVAVPCPDCTEVLYCSASCAQLHRSQGGGHQFGCRLLGHLTQRSKSTASVFNMLNRIGVKGVLKAIEESGEWASKEEEEEKEENAFLYDMTAYSKDADQRFTAEVHKDEALRRQAYQAQMTLYSHYEKYPIGCLSSAMINAIECAITAAIAQGFTYEQLSSSSEPVDHPNQLETLIAHCFVAIRRVLTNCFRWSGRDKSSGGSRVHFAICYHLVGSLFNHACDPNAEWGIDGGVITLTTVREVQCGEELTISYGPTKAQPFAQRQKRLLNGYYFQCNCSLCIADCKREEGVLKCPACTGPVPAGKAVSSSAAGNAAACLACGQPLKDAPEKAALLENAFIDLEIKTRLMMSAALVAGKKKKEDEATHNQNCLVSLRQTLQTIAELIYSPSHRLLQALYQASRVLFEQGHIEECLVFGELVDCWMPVKVARAAELLVISAGDGGELNDGEEEGEGEGKQETDSSLLWDVNLDHLAFWCTVYRLVIERTGSGATDQEGHWCTLLRFNGRLKRLLKSMLATKAARLAELKAAREAAKGEDEQQKKVKSSSKVAGSSEEYSILRQEILLLEQLKEHKAQQLAELKAQFTEHQIDFEHLEAVSLGA